MNMWVCTLHRCCYFFFGESDDLGNAAFFYERVNTSRVSSTNVYMYHRAWPIVTMTCYVSTSLQPRSLPGLQWACSSVWPFCMASSSSCSAAEEQVSGVAEALQWSQNFQNLQPSNSPPLYTHTLQQRLNFLVSWNTPPHPRLLKCTMQVNFLV